jgi:leucyl/phenylalanyl-tRNA--protein transferase
MPQLSWLDAEQGVNFPPTRYCLKNPPGLLAAGGALTPEWLLGAYERGIFPWFSDGEPILWWSPEPRMVLIPGEMHLSRSLRKAYRRSPLRVTVNMAFSEVITACQAPRAKQPGTWITPEMQTAYTNLHELGWAHSFEVWQGSNLVGGLYGIGIDGLFFGESMFSRYTNASKIALVAVQEAAMLVNLRLIDCQVYNDHLASLGAREVGRSWFEQQLPQERLKLLMPDDDTLNHAIASRMTMDSQEPSNRDLADEA